MFFFLSLYRNLWLKHQRFESTLNITDTRGNDIFAVIDHLNSWFKWIFYFNNPDTPRGWLIWHHCTVGICYNKTIWDILVWSSELWRLISTSEQRKILFNVCIRSLSEENREQDPQSIKQWLHTNKWDTTLKVVELGSNATKCNAMVSKAVALRILLFDSASKAIGQGKFWHYYLLK